MGKRPKDMCPFRYWRAREGNSECIARCHQSPETKGYIYGQKPKLLESKRGKFRMDR